MPASSPPTWFRQTSSPANKNQDVFHKVQIELSVKAVSKDQGGALGMTAREALEILLTVNESDITIYTRAVAVCAF
jgi:hypothetical protein